MSFRAAVLAALALTLTSSCSDSAAVDGPLDAGPEVRIEDLRSTRLEDLATAEAEALCEASVRATNTCVHVALAGPLYECKEHLEACEDDPPALEFECQGVRYVGHGGCAATVGEFLECLKAYEASLSCEPLPRSASTVEACVGVVSACPFLEATFGAAGNYIPECAPVDEAPAVPKPLQDLHGDPGCRTLPGRVVVLGDSIANCTGLPSASNDDEAGSPDCPSRKVWARLGEIAGGEVPYEDYAANFTFVGQVAERVQTVAGGSEHVLVYIQVIGNDLGSFQGQGPDAFRAGVDDLLPIWIADFDAILAHFNDTALFPAGATFFINTQYSPYDRCPDPSGDRHGIPIASEDTIIYANEELLVRLAGLYDNVLVADHYPAWLGHGTNANDGACPHCGADNSLWMSDSQHPNALGYAHIADVWLAAVERAYGAACR